MPRPEDTIRMRHMLEHAEEAVSYARGKARADLDSDRILSLALVPLLEIVGEAGSRVSEEGRAEVTSIVWPQIIGLRNRIVHGYDAVDMDIVWVILTNDLPPLIAELEKILPPDPKG